MTTTTDADATTAALARVFVALGPVYRTAARIVERDETSSGLSVGVRAVLDELRREGACTVPQLARRQALSRQFVQRMVNDAGAAGLVELVDNPAHRRSRLVRLTPDGRTTIETVLAREHELMQQLRVDLSADELETTARVLTAMQGSLREIARAE